MHTKITRRGPELALQIASVWDDHCRALQRGGLTYLDTLIDALLALQPMTKDELRRKLTGIAPSLRWGTAGRLIEAKFGDVRYDHLLGPKVG